MLHPLYLTNDVQKFSKSDDGKYIDFLSKKFEKKRKKRKSAKYENIETIY